MKPFIHKSTEFLHLLPHTVTLLCAFQM